MDLAWELRNLALIGPGLLMMVLGFWLTLRSGVVSLSTEEGLSQAAKNVTELLTRLVLLLLLMLLLFDLIGFRALGTF